MQKKPIILKPGVVNNGYEFVILCVNKLTKKKAVHRLVAEAFIENPMLLPEVNHKNGNKRDNRTENLEWCSHRANILHAWNSGLALGRNKGKSLYRLLEPEVGSSGVSFIAIGSCQARNIGTTSPKPT
jgi:hypothetical protein